jgi:hypothetical protein
MFQIGFSTITQLVVTVVSHTHLGIVGQWQFLVASAHREMRF